MSTITPAAFEQYQISNQDKTEKTSELGQDEFLKLMLTQLKHQDPFKPMENGEFIGQMAQFSTVSGIEQMQASLENLAGTFGANQTLEASRLIGNEILIEADTAFLADTGEVQGRFDMASISGDVQLEVFDASGKLIRHIELGQLPAGRHEFSWDGNNNNGQRVPGDEYTFKVNARYGEEYSANPVFMTRLIDSVEFAQGGNALLNTKSGDVLTLADIREVRQSQAPAAE